MKRVIGVVAGVVIAAVTAGVSLQVSGEEPTAYEVDAISNGDFTTAERRLTAILDKNPNDPYALLNLAFVYQKSGQADKARDLYQRILEQRQNPLAELPQGRKQPVKTIAQRGINALPEN